MLCVLVCDTTAEYIKVVKIHVTDLHSFNFECELCDMLVTKIKEM